MHIHKPQPLGVKPWRRIAVVLPIFLASCASVPNVCPSLPEPPAPVQAEPNFLDRMQNFLSGKLPEPTSTLSPSTPASSVSGQSTKR